MSSRFTLILFLSTTLYHRRSGGADTSPCPALCPSGWVTFPLAQTNHCYLLPPKPIPLKSFWEMQQYCVSQQPTSYILEMNTGLEESGVGVQAMKYFEQYAADLGDFWVWIGAYYENGQWHWLSGAPFAWSAFAVTLSVPPTNGTCVYWDPKGDVYAWRYRPCSDTRGATACEMEAIVDCSATYPPTTTPGPYVPPDCEQAAWTEFTQSYQRGYLGVGAESELMWLSNMDLSSCSVACMYYSSCLSFDIDTATGDCRLLQASSRFTCSFVDEPVGEWQHYDRASGST